MEVEAHINSSRPNIRDVGTQVSAEFGALDPFLDEFESWKPKSTRKKKSNSISHAVGRGGHSDDDDDDGDR